MEVVVLNVSVSRQLWRRWEEGERQKAVVSFLNSDI